MPKATTLPRRPTPTSIACLPIVLDGGADDIFTTKGRVSFPPPNTPLVPEGRAAPVAVGRAPVPEANAASETAATPDPDGCSENPRDGSGVGK